MYDDIAAGEWLHEKLVASFGLETEAWATERVARVTDRLNRVRAGCPVPGACSCPLRTEILWMQEMNAYAAPGRYIYLSRELLQRAASDEPIALVVAHEMAHHDLGHTRLLGVGGVWDKLRAGPESLVLLAALWRLVERQFIGADREDTADAYALHLCIASGYHGSRCLELFDILEAYALDHRDIDGVFGPDLSGRTAQLWRRARGYSSLHARRAAVTALVSEYAAAAATR